MLDVDAIRAQFPLLNRPGPNGRPLAYLDSAATAQKPQRVLDALQDFYTRYNANVHRGIYAIAEEATAAYEGAREKVARWIGADTDEVIFTRNCTEALNLVRFTWGRANLKPGDELAFSEMEHHSNLVPWQLLAEETGARLRFIRITDDGLLDGESLQAAVTERTKLVSVAHVSNVLGTVNPIDEIADLAHSRGAVLCVDGAQAAPHLRLDVRALGCDFYAFSGHKMFGPTGSGVLWGRSDLLEAMPPFHGGGEMIREVTLEHSTYKDPPARFEAGTPNIAQAIGLGVAVDFLASLPMDAVHAHERDLVAACIEGLRAEPGVTVYGPDLEHRSGAVAFSMAGIHPHDIAQVLDAEGVCVRAGHHCAQPLHQRLGVEATARASVACYTTHEDIARLLAGVRKVREFFGDVVAGPV